MGPVGCLIILVAGIVVGFICGAATFAAYVEDPDPDRVAKLFRRDIAKAAKEPWRPKCWMCPLPCANPDCESNK